MRYAHLSKFFFCYYLLQLDTSIFLLGGPVYKSHVLSVQDPSRMLSSWAQKQTKSLWYSPFMSGPTRYLLEFPSWVLRNISSKAETYGGKHLQYWPTLMLCAWIFYEHQYLRIGVTKLGSIVKHLAGWRIVLCILSTSPQLEHAHDFNNPRASEIK